MDSTLKARVYAMAKQLAEQEQQRLRAAGTFVELEELACEIGDEFTRQLMAGELADRSVEVSEAESQTCPDCGQASTKCQTQHRKLDSSRGSIDYYEPAFQCPSCRRSFFPDGRLHGITHTSYGDSQTDSADGMGR